MALSNGWVAFAKPFENIFVPLFVSFIHNSLYFLFGRFAKYEHLSSPFPKSSFQDMEKSRVFFSFPDSGQFRSKIWFERKIRQLVSMSLKLYFFAFTNYIWFDWLVK